MNSCTQELSLAEQHVVTDCAHAELVTCDGEIEITVSALPRCTYIYICIYIVRRLHDYTLFFS